jgi:hypothetical protein
MRDQAFDNQETGNIQGQASGSDQILKVTALLYLKEAIIAQEYESCRELIDIAKNLGAVPGDISAVIKDSLL